MYTLSSHICCPHPNKPMNGIVCRADVFGLLREFVREFTVAQLVGLVAKLDRKLEARFKHGLASGRSASHGKGYDISVTTPQIIISSSLLHQSLETKSGIKLNGRDLQEQLGK